jgi:hypothetical protein
VLALITEASEVEAERTVALVFELTDAVPAVIAEAIEDEAVLVLALITAASEVEAPRTVELVLELTAEVMPAVFETIEALRDEEALFVLLLIAVSVELRLAAVASEPVSSVPSERRRVAYVQTSEAVREEPLVNVLVPFVHTSAAKVPKVVREREVADQTAVGIVEASEVEAVRTVALVLLLIVVIAEET